MRKILFLKSLILFLATNFVATAQVKTNIEEQGTIDLWYYAFLIVAGSFLCLVVSKILTVYETARIYEGKSEINWNSILGILLILLLIVGLFGVYWSFDNHGRQILPESASAHGVSIDFLMYTTTIIILIPFVFTHVLLLSFPYIYRSRKGNKALFYPDNHKLERGWAGMIAVVLIILVGWGFYIWNGIMYTSDGDKDKIVNVNVTGEQYKWTIRYPGDDGLYGETNYKLINSDNSIGLNLDDTNALDDQLAGEIVLPVNQIAKIKINSKDVLHSFYLPHFRVQMNAVPGMDTYFKFTPTITTEEMRKKLNNPDFNYVLLCAKICGSGHYNMQAKVTIVSNAEYEKWVKDLPLF